jgi:uncharacterized protein
MDWLFVLLTIVGLSLFEIVSSVDNAIINAEVLRKMSAWARRWFLLWGILIAVFVIRGLLPLVIIWITNPHLTLVELLRLLLSNDSRMVTAFEASAPVLLIGGGTFLILLFLHWLFLEPKHYGLIGENLAERYGIWFYALASLFLVALTWNAVHINPIMAFSAAVGSAAFFITHGFKQNAEEMEKKMMAKDSGMSDISKIMYLEVIDATFSIDGVLGAFAFTMSVPLILIGNGLGAIVVRKMTVANIENVKKYKYLKNGAMYSILFLGLFMIFESFDAHLPQWLSPVMTILIIGYFFQKSKVELEKKIKRSRT